MATTVDSQLQEEAARAVQAGAAKVADRHPGDPSPQGALVALDTDSGRIRAMGRFVAKDKGFRQHRQHGG